MAMAFDECFEHWWLILEVILSTKMSKAAMLILDRTHRRAFGMQFMNINTMLFKNSLQTFWFAIWKSHFLWLTVTEDWREDSTPQWYWFTFHFQFLLISLPFMIFFSLQGVVTFRVTCLSLVTCGRHMLEWLSFLNPIPPLLSRYRRGVLSYFVNNQ